MATFGSVPGAGVDIDVGPVDQIGILQPDRAVLDDLQFGARETDVAVAFDDLLFLLRRRRTRLASADRASTAVRLAA